MESILLITKKCCLAVVSPQREDGSNIHAVIQKTNEMVRTFAFTDRDGEEA